MESAKVITQCGEAIRRTKYYSGGNQEWKARAATKLDKRYATAAIAELLFALADTGRTYSPAELTAMALDIEREGGDL